MDLKLVPVCVWAGFRGNSVPAEGLPGLHSLPDSQRRELRPGGAGQDDAWSERRLPWLLQRLQQPLPQPREVHREEQRLHLRLLAVRLRRHHLQPRWGANKSSAPFFINERWLQPTETRSLSRLFHYRAPMQAAAAPETINTCHDCRVGEHLKCITTNYLLQSVRGRQNSKAGTKRQVWAQLGWAALREFGRKDAVSFHRWDCLSRLSQLVYCGVEPQPDEGHTLRLEANSSFIHPHRMTHFTPEPSAKLASFAININNFKDFTSSLRLPLQPMKNKDGKIILMLMKQKKVDISNAVGCKNVIST